ncbi:MAG: VWA domain-containing protein, partial [Pseudomonadota bacterium]|nr:VWA domain-containing protein [Pseudomonadota bacterium]
MARRKRAETDSFTVSFLDVASCGFGAMIILLMIVKPADPAMIEVSEVPQEASVTELQEQLFEIRGETRILNRDLNAKHEQLSALTDRIARLRRDLSDIEGRYQTSQQLSDETTDEIGKLAVARQTLTEEMQRLLANVVSPENNAIGGVPVDSEYIIFLIDTSGSMYNTPGNWNTMLEVIDNTLDVYPEV